MTCIIADRSHLKQKEQCSALEAFNEVKDAFQPFRTEYGEGREKVMDVKLARLEEEITKIAGQQKQADVVTATPVPVHHGSTVRVDHQRGANVIGAWREAE